MSIPPSSSFVFFFNDTATTEIYTLSLHDALPISLNGHRTAAPYLPVPIRRPDRGGDGAGLGESPGGGDGGATPPGLRPPGGGLRDARAGGPPDRRRGRRPGADRLPGGNLRLPDRAAARPGGHPDDRRPPRGAPGVDGEVRGRDPRRRRSEGGSRRADRQKGDRVTRIRALTRALTATSFPPILRPPRAKVAELVDAQGSGPCGLNSCGGSSPPFRTTEFPPGHPGAVQ